MTAALDRGRNYGDRGGGMSDPILIERVGQVVGNTEDEIATVAKLIDKRFAASDPARAELHEMLFGKPSSRAALVGPVSMAAAREARAERRVAA